MKLSSLKLLLASLACSSIAIAGCAADTTATDGEGAEDVGMSSEEISSRAQQFVGSYAWRPLDSAVFLDFQQLTLKSDGVYSALVDAQLVDPKISCLKFPCAVPESGRWSIVSSGGKLKVKVNPTGAKPSRSYWATIQPQTRMLTLTRNNRTTDLFAEGSTCANVRCTANTQCEMLLVGGAWSPSCTPTTPPVATCAVTLCTANSTCIDTPTGAKCVAIDPPPMKGCVKTGCSGQICADGQRFSTCEYSPAYACYQTATCAVQANGQCGWTETPELTSCLSSNDPNK
jgi:hypothetical protein